MKKLFAIALSVVMLAAMVVPMTVNAAGVLLFQDTFDENLIDNWMTVESHFECVDGHLEGYHDAVVHQSQYQEEYGDDGAEGNKLWGAGTSFKVECWAYDSDSAGDNLRQGIWWADYFEQTFDNEGRITYTFYYNFVTDQFTLEGSFEKSGLDLFPDPDDLPVVEEGAEPLAGFSCVLESADAPDFKMDMNDADHYTLGMKVDNGVIYCYCNDKQIFAHQAERGAICGTEAKSPFLLWNIGLWCCFDNVQVATADYCLFGEKAEDTQAPGTDAPVVTEPLTTKIEEVVVTEIGEDGEIVTRIETQIVTAAPQADTQNQPSGGNTTGGAQTGDMAVIVIAVMVAALGAAVVVKKVND